MIKRGAFILVLCVFIAIFYSLSRQIYNSLSAGRRLDQAASDLAQLQRKNLELKKKLKDVGGVQFVEEQARDKLNMARDGETVVIIPDKEIDKILNQGQKPPEKVPNWQGWLKLFI